MMEPAARIFVAGAAGMFGAAVARRFRAQGFTNLVGIDKSPELDDAAAVDRFFASARPEYVVIAAGAHAGIAGNQRYPADLMLDNLHVVSHVIPAAWRHGVKKLLFVASSCSYPKHAPQPLEIASLWTGALEPTSAAYATSQLAGLTLCEAYRQQHGARFIGAIKADVFGPGDDFGEERSHVVAALLKRMHTAKEANASAVEIWGTGSPRREFIYADDFGDACVFLMQHYDDAAPINIGTGTTTSIREVAEMLRRLIGFKGELVFDTSRPDGIPLKGLESAPLRTLGWQPAWALEPALRATYEWFLAHDAAHV